MPSKTVSLHAKYKKLFFTHAPNVAVLKGRDRIPFSKGFGVGLLPLLVL